MTHDIAFSIIHAMSSADKLIAKMRNNPRDWQIDTLVSIADKHGIEVRSHGGSHYIFSHPKVSFHPSVPAHRPIKPVYVKQFIDLIDAVKELEK
ncbi:MAG: hypothetical protein PHQ63_07735 [Smithellaceae bacterium]|nr:hypothetical protein [Smithellaceae bacterium]